MNTWKGRDLHLSSWNCLLCVGKRKLLIYNQARKAAFRTQKYVLRTEAMHTRMAVGGTWKMWGPDRGFKKILNRCPTLCPCTPAHTCARLKTNPKTGGQWQEGEGGTFVQVRSHSGELWEKAVIEVDPNPLCRKFWKCFGLLAKAGQRQVLAPWGLRHLAQGPPCPPRGYKANLLKALCLEGWAQRLWWCCHRAWKCCSSPWEGRWGRGAGQEGRNQEMQI